MCLSGRKSNFFIYVRQKKHGVKGNNGTDTKKPYKFWERGRTKVIIEKRKKYKIQPGGTLDKITLKIYSPGFCFAREAHVNHTPVRSSHGAMLSRLPLFFPIRDGKSHSNCSMNVAIKLIC